MSLIGTLVLALAPVAADQPAPITRATGQCQAARVVPVSRSRLDRTAEWSARDVIDLRLEARLRPGAEAREIEFRVYTPGGHLYRTLKAPAVSLDDPEGGEDLRRRPPVGARASLPVAGTGIVRNGLYGSWKVVPHLAGEARPCGRAFSFDLVP